MPEFNNYKLESDFKKTGVCFGVFEPNLHIKQNYAYET